MYRNKVIILTTLTIILLIIAAIIAASITRKTPDTNIDVNKPSTTNTIIPTTRPTVPVNKKLILLNIYPPEDESIEQLPIKQIEFEFNKPINKDRFSYRVSPEVQTFISIEGTSVIVSPRIAWELGTTTITINPDTTSTDGSLLNETIIYTLNVALPGGV